MKKKVLSMLLTTVLVIGLTACGTTDAAKDKETEKVTEEAKETSTQSEGIDVGTGVPLTSSDITLVIGEQGYYLTPIILNQGWLDEVFGPANIKVELANFSNGPEMIEAFTAGQLDIAPMGIQPAISGVANNAGVQVVAGFTDSEQGIQINSLEGSGITTIEDLKGKTVAGTIGSNAYSLLVKVFKEHGLSIDTDINFVNLDFSGSVTALESGEVDAAVSFASVYNNVAATDGVSFYTIQDATGYGISAGVLTVRTEYAKNYADVIENVLVIYQWAEEFLANNQDEAVQIIADYNGVDVSVIEDTLALYDYSFIDPDVIGQNLVDYADYMYDNELISNEYTLDDIADFSYFEAAGIQ